MATYVSAPTGGTFSGTAWLQTSSTAENDSVATGTAATTAFQYSSTFVPAAADYAGVAVRVYSRSAATVGTVTVYLANNTSPGVREGSVTLQISDFDNLQNQNSGWAFFKFPSTKTPNGTDAYKIGICTSQYVFTVSGITTTPTPGATYTNNGFTFTVQGATISSGSGIISTSGTGAPSASGTLTKSAGTGDSSISFSVATTSTGTMSFYSLATTNWSRELVSSASGSPVAGDKLLIMGAWTAGTVNDSLSNSIVTMDSTAATSYGPTVSGGPPDGMSISMGGTLLWGNMAATAYRLVVKGTLAIYPGGTLNISGATNGQVSYYPFENSSANDLVGANNGTLNGSPTFATGKIGQAVVLNGSSQSVALPSAISTLLSISSAWAVSLWFNATTVSGTQTILGSAVSSSNEVYLQIVSGNLTSLRYNGSVYSGFTSTVLASTWYHVALVSNGVITALYVNGVMVSTVTASGTTSGTNATYLGCDSTGGAQWFSGMIDDVNFYSRVLSPSEISSIYSNATSLTGYWAFENSAAYDLSGNGNNGSLVGSPSFTTGIAGNAISLNGSSQSVTLTDTTALKSNNITVSVWYQSTAPVSSAVKVLFDHQYTTPFYGYQLGVTAAGQIFFSVKGSGSMVTVTGTTVMVANQWYHLVGTYNGSTITTYVNGLVDGTPTACSGNIDYTSSVTPTIGARVGGSLFTNGLIDEVRVYNTALTVSQVGALFISDRCFPFPASSSALLTSGSVANVDSGVVVYNNGVLAMSGNPLLYDRCLLAADVIATATSLTTSVATGWSTSNVWGTGDSIVIASTSTTYSQNDVKVLTSVSGSTLGFSALTYAHSGTTPTQAEIIHLTRNIKIQGASATLCGYIYYYGSSVVSTQWTEFTLLGSTTANKRGIDFATIGGSLLMNYCSFHDGNSTASSTCMTTTVANTNNVTFSNNVFWNLLYPAIYMQTDTTNVLVVNNNWVVGCTYGLVISAPCTFTNNRVMGITNYGIGHGRQVFTNLLPLGIDSGNIAHSCGTDGYSWVPGTSVYAPITGTVTNLTAWKNGGYGLNILDGDGVTFNGIVAFGNTTANLKIGPTVQCYFMNGVFNGTSGYGVYISGLNPSTMFGNCTFGVTTTHTNGDIVITSTANRNSIIFNNCLFNSSTVLNTGNSTWQPGTSVSFENYQQVNGNHKTIKPEGTLSTDSTIYYSLATGPSERVAPVSLLYTCDSSRRRTSCAQGNSITFSCYVRLSVLGDGTAFNGTSVGLYLLANPSMGVSVDTLLASATIGTAGVWQLLSGTTPISNSDGTWETCIRINGTTGWINVANWSVA